MLRRPKQFLEELMERILTLMSSGNNQEMELVTQVIHNIMGYLAIMKMVDIHHCSYLIIIILFDAYIFF